MSIKRNPVYTTPEIDRAFSIWDDHWFPPSSKEDSLTMLYGLRTKAYRSWKFWANYDPERDEDGYVYYDDPDFLKKNEIEEKKREFYLIDHLVERVENGPDDQCWRLDQYTMRLYPVKRAW